MPWCEDCARYLTPTSLGPDGTCPTCQRQLADPKKAPRVPWHFWLLLIALVLYLGWRLVQGIDWVIQHV
jgi:hypothetical protein